MNVGSFEASPGVIQDTRENDLLYYIRIDLAAKTRNNSYFHERKELS